MAQAVFDLSSIDGTNGFTIEGLGETYGSAGSRVAGLGDINGDGFDDFIIGAFVDQPHGQLSGSSYVVFGHGGSFASTLMASALDGSNGFILNGSSEEFSGYGVHAAGDVNGDGIADLIVGAPHSSGNGSYSGMSYIVFGHKGGSFPASLTLSTLDGVNGFALAGPANAGSGNAVSAGDVNGDGFDDIIATAPGLTVPPFSHYAGAAFVVFGHGGSFSPRFQLSSVDGSNGFELYTARSHSYFGNAASIGDLNGDGFADIIIGASQASPKGASSGEAYVVFGHAGAFSSMVDVDNLDGSNGFAVTGHAVDQFIGKSVTTVDLNHDGYADLVIGGSGVNDAGNSGFGGGDTYVLFGHAGGFAPTIDITTALDGTNGFRIVGSSSQSAGYSVASAGDFNGDGYDDLIIGAPRSSYSGSQSGSSYLIYGHAGGFGAVINLSDIDGTNGFRIDGVSFSNNSGHSVSGAGDVNGDGFDDLLVGAPYASDTAKWSGDSYIIFGHGAPPVAENDAFTTTEAKVLGARQNLFADNGSGADTGHTLTVSAVDGEAGNVGHQFALASGAFLDVDANGTFTYDPNHAFDYLGHGQSATDTFTYSLAGGSDGTVTITISGLDTNDTVTGSGSDDKLNGGNGDDMVSGGDGNDVIQGGAGNDQLSGDSGDDVLKAGTGNDTLSGGDGNDKLEFGGDYNGSDVADGGAGTDTLELSGDYSAGLDITPASLIRGSSISRSRTAFPTTSRWMTATLRPARACSWTPRDCRRPIR